MPPQTFAHGGAIRLAMERPRDDVAVISERANDRMLLQERQWFLLCRLASQEPPHSTEPPTTVRKGDFAGFFQGFAGMLLRERQEPLQHPRSFNATGAHDGL